MNGSPAREAPWTAWPREIARALAAVVASPRYSLPAVLSLMLGLGATTAVFAIFNGVVLRPLPFGEEGSLVALFDDLNAPGLERAPVSAPELEDFRRTQSLAAVAAFEQAEGTVTGLGEPRHVILGRVTPNLFETLQVTPSLGRTFVSTGASRDGIDVAVVSHRFWMSALGGTAQAIGRTLVVDGTARTIVGVLPDEQAMPASAEVWTPIQFTPEQATSRGYRFLQAVARVKDGATLESAQRELEVASRNAAAQRRPVKGVIVPAREWLLGSTKPYAQMMLVAVILFLLLACTNVASLFLTRASVKNRELAIRAAIGASRRRLLVETLLEAAIVAIAGGALGLGLAFFAVRAAGAAYSDLLSYAQPAIDGRVLGFSAAICLATVGAVGAAPALRAARVQPMDALREGNRGSGGRATRRLREALVAAQVTATVVLLVGAGILTRSVMALTRVDAGFDATGVVTARVSLPQDKYSESARTLEAQRQMTDALRTIPGVTSAAVTTILPFGDTNEAVIGVEARGASLEKVHAEERHVTPDYFKTMGVRLLEGRVVEAGDHPDTEKIAVVNRTFAKSYFLTSNVLGRRFTTGETDAEGNLLWKHVVGVVDDTREFGLDADPKPMFFLPFAQAAATDFAVTARASTDAESVLPEVHRRLRAVDATVTIYDLRTMTSRLEASYATRTVMKWLLLAFGGAAMILAAIGLFGVTSYSVSLRMREIGIRRAIGASRAAIMRMILGETGAVVGLGLCAGVAAAWYGMRFLSAMIYGVGASDAVTYGSVSVAVFAASFLAAVPPSLAAASVKPEIALRVD